MRVVCHSCSRAASFDTTVPRSAECDGCGADLRCCRNCRFYDPTAYNECNEPSAERVVDKERANFCDYFSGVGETRSGRREGEGDAKSALDKLFKS